MTSHLENISRGALGMIFLVLVCYLLSNNKKAINWKLVGIGILAQIMFAMGVLNTKIGGQPVFWLFFGGILLYNIYSKINSLRKIPGAFSINRRNAGLVVLWQVVFFLWESFKVRNLAILDW